MTDAEPITPDQFEIAARETLSPVLVAAGLKEVSWAVAWQVQRGRFESDEVWAEVVHNPPGGQLWLFLDRIDGAPGGRARFDVRDAIALADRSAAALHPRYIARTAAEARASLERLAGDVARYCGPALHGAPEVFEAMAAEQEDQRVKRAEWEERAAAMGLDDAVAQHEWARVADIWATATHELNGAAKRRSCIARQNARTLHFSRPQGDHSELLEALDLEYRAHGPWAGEDPEREATEHAVGEAMDAMDWVRVAGLYESAAYDLDYLELTRLEIARERLGEPGAGGSPAEAPRALAQRRPWQAPGAAGPPPQVRPARVALAHQDADGAIARLVGAWLAAPATDAQATPDPHSPLVESLAAWIPDLLSRAQPGRGSRRAASFSFASLAQGGPAHVNAVGQCAFMFERAPAGFALDLRLTATGAIDELRLRIGEPGARDVGTAHTADAPAASEPQPAALELDLSVEFIPRGDGEFSKADKNLIVSRAGFAVRSRPPNTVVYHESGQELSMFVEMLMTEQMALTTRLADLKGWSEPRGASHLPDDERARIARNVQRALAWDGTTLLVT